MFFFLFLFIIHCLLHLYNPRNKFPWKLCSRELTQYHSIQPCYEKHVKPVCNSEPIRFQKHFFFIPELLLLAFWETWVFSVDIYRLRSDCTHYLVLLVVFCIWYFERYFGGIILEVYFKLLSLLFWKDVLKLLTHWQKFRQTVFKSICRHLI